MLQNASPRKARDDVSTGDLGVYMRFLSANVCNLTSKPHEHEDPPPPPIDERFKAEGRAFSAGDFTVVRARMATKGCNARRPSHIRHDIERRYCLTFPVAGEIEVSQFGRSERCLAGAANLMSGSEPLTYGWFSGNDTVSLLMPEQFVDQRLVRTEQLCGRAIGVKSGVRRLLSETVISLYAAAGDIAEADLHKTFNVVTELAILAVGDLPDLMSSASPVRSANLARAKRLIRARFADPDLTLESVADECGISVRYLHYLFRDQGVTTWEYVLAERLQRARRMLETAVPGAVNVTDICLACGFSNLSHFSTAFKRQFGVSPKDILRPR